MAVPLLASERQLGAILLVRKTQGTTFTAGDEKLLSALAWQAAIARRTIHGPVTPQVPASYLQRHPRCTITMTEEVAAPPGVAPK